MHESMSPKFQNNHFADVFPAHLLHRIVRALFGNLPGHPACRPDRDLGNATPPVLKAHRPSYHSTLGSRVIKKKKTLPLNNMSNLVEQHLVGGMAKASTKVVRGRERGGERARAPF